MRPTLLKIFTNKVGSGPAKHPGPRARANGCRRSSAVLLPRALSHPYRKHSPHPPPPRPTHTRPLQVAMGFDEAEGEEAMQVVRLSSAELSGKPIALRVARFTNVHR